jgi:hypothetical protein
MRESVTCAVTFVSPSFRAWPARERARPRERACVCIGIRARAPESVCALAQALLHLFEARIPRLFLAVYVLVERLPCIELGQDRLPQPTRPLRTLPSLAKFFRTVPGKLGPSGRAFTFE